MTEREVLRCERSSGLPLEACYKRVLLPGRAKRDFSVYVLRCRDGSLYVGITNRLAHRISKHQAGVGAKYTRSRRPVSLVWKRGQKTGAEARRLEHALKSLPRSEKLRLVEGNRSVWRKMLKSLISR